jgi:5-methyltetrahydropteroyltriglutamate--homocysteine methyltransferase
MKRSTGRILVTHVGRLSGPPEFSKLDMSVQRGEPYDRKSYLEQRRNAVDDIVRRQAEAGIDVVSDGELGKSRGYPYYSKRLDGISQRPLRLGETPVTVFKTRERERFKEYYQEVDRERAKSVVSTPDTMKMVCVGPLKSKDLSVLQDEIATFKTGLSGVKVAEAFVPLLAPGWLDHFLFNEYYKSDEEFVYAIAEAMRPEYQAVVGAGLLLQIDDPGLPDAWPTFFPEPSVEEYRKYAKVRVDALNHALRGFPEDRVRYHICWGSQHGPHVDDLPFRHIIDLLLEVRAQGYCIEAANVRHEHEWRVWQEVKPPEGTVLIPGVVTHATNLIEHPELVAERIVRLAKLAGRENLLAGTDCGFSQGPFSAKVHPSIQWAKLKALVDGAELASKELWP